MVASPSSADPLYINKVAPYLFPEKVSEAVRAECGLPQRLPESIRKEIIDRAGFGDVVLTDDPLPGDKKLALMVSIVNVAAPHGGGWSTGTKFVKIKATLYRNGQVTGEFARSASGSSGGNRGGVWYAKRGNCQILNRWAEDLSGHAAAWLKKNNLLDSGPLSGPVPEGRSTTTQN